MEVLVSSGWGDTVVIIKLILAVIVTKLQV